MPFLCWNDFTVTYLSLDLLASLKSIHFGVLVFTLTHTTIPNFGIFLEMVQNENQLFNHHKNDCFSLTMSIYYLVQVLDKQHCRYGALAYCSFFSKKFYLFTSGHNAFMVDLQYRYELCCELISLSSSMESVTL